MKFWNFWKKEEEEKAIVNDMVSQVKVPTIKLPSVFNSKYYLTEIAAIVNERCASKKVKIRGYILDTS